MIDQASTAIMAVYPAAACHADPRVSAPTDTNPFVFSYQYSVKTGDHQNLLAAAQRPDRYQGLRRVSFKNLILGDKLDDARKAIRVTRAPRMMVRLRIRL